MKLTKTELATCKEFPSEIMEKLFKEFEQDVGAKVLKGACSVEKGQGAIIAFKWLRKYFKK